MNVGWLGDTTPKGCKRCKEQRSLEVAMDATQTYDPSQCVYVDVWECPECERIVYRDEGDGVGMMTPGGERF
jgi:hypothetical protein